MLKKAIIALGLLFGSLLSAWAVSTALSGLSSGGAISATDLFYDVQTAGVGGVKVTGTQFLNFVFGNVSGACTASGSGVFTCPASSTATFTNMTSTVASAGFLTASGAHFQTLTIAGSINVGVRSASSAAVTASAVSDYFLCLDATSATITVALPSSPATGLTYLVKDCTGQAATHGIILSPSTGNIDGAANSILTRTYGSEAVTYTGSQWSVN